MADCEYFGLGKTCKCTINCRDTYCPQHPDYYKVRAVEDANYLQVLVGKRVRAYSNAQKYAEGVRCVTGKVLKVFVKGHKVAYKVEDNFGRSITSHYIEETLFQDY